MRPDRKCRCCGAEYLSPRPGLNALDVIYPQNYGNYHTGEDEGKSYVRMISNKLQGWRLRRVITENIEMRPALKVLDAGCGDGFSLDRIKEQFSNVETFGVEPNAIAAQQAGKRHKVLQGVFEEYVTDERIDVIVSSCVIEHVEDPLGFLIKTHIRIHERESSPTGTSIPLIVSERRACTTWA